MLRQDISHDITALIYGADGQRTAARVSMCDYPMPIGGDFVFCEAALAHELTTIYGGAARAPQIAARLHTANDIWHAGQAASPAQSLGVRPLGGMERGVVRGIYALACQAQPCFARESRAIWDALMAVWRAAGLSVWLYERGGRALAYALMGNAECGKAQTPCRFLYEFAALPDSAVTLPDALSAACALNVCASEVRMLGSALSIE